MKGFRDFILRGNVIDLAVAVVIGAAFTAIVNSIVTSVINPAISALFQADSLNEALPVSIPTTSGGESTMYFGAVIGAAINFLIVAAVVYFVLVLPVNKLRERQAAQKGIAAEEAGPTETQLLAEIRDLLAEQK
ncbi:large conductance mechanosensitive channel protein MscL [Homoserinibacter sp. GY 40078]|uniref:large conductance mechanosensitive channel protein MscL n=1 Tax=Homoserinibacter sp. GY 40078 TaxID=2603275 RepID=UPI0011C8E1BE|nr:large conductance mechanosensitive channel protein MscL [Homoserinibacter sp. GY 40078]TXK19401.1 large conductance mechanosensitive channel protein MscL [Homoserinibacter sp. GY 40078]